MAWVERGRVQGGALVFSTPLALPEGTEVLVQIEPLAQGEPADQEMDEDQFARLPFFGMWADREDLPDSAEWVRRERQQWQQRAARQD
jgi:hypothetical protein